MRVSNNLHQDGDRGSVYTDPDPNLIVLSINNAFTVYHPLYASSYYLELKYVQSNNTNSGWCCISYI